MLARIVWIDWAKTICIFLMVVGHWTTNNTLLLYIYSFHMPALFAVSGFLYKPYSWKNTILSFAIPVAFFSLINICFLLCIGEFNYNYLFSRAFFCRFFHFRYGLGDGFYCGDWFLWALFGLRLFFGDIRTFAVFRRYYLLICSCVIMYMSFETYLVGVDKLFHGWYIGRLVPSMPFFCLGFLIKDLSWKPQNVSFYIVGLLGFATFLIPIINGYSSINSNDYGMSYMLFFIGASLAILFVLVLSSYMPQMKFVSVISNGTLLILGLHIPVMRALDLFLPSFMHDYLSLLVLPICYYPIQWVNKMCPALIGKLKYMKTS